LMAQWKKINFISRRHVNNRKVVDPNSADIFAADWGPSTKVSLHRRWNNEKVTQKCLVVDEDFRRPKLAAIYVSNHDQNNQRMESMSGKTSRSLKRMQSV